MVASGVDSGCRMNAEENRGKFSMRKIKMLLLCSVLFLTGSLSIFAENNETLFVVGHTTQLNGQFFTSMWGNSTSDIDVRALLHDYATVAWSKNGNIVINDTVVSSFTSENDRNGDKIYKIKLKSGLKYNDGTAITAKDYVFSVLLESSPYIAQLSGNAVGNDFIVGAKDYLIGTTHKLAGLHLVDESTFSITVSKKFLPYYYDHTYASVMPYPIHVIAPNCEVKDNGEGAYISGDFSAELLRETILNPDTGYLSHPMVTCGPYQMKSYDATTHEAVFTINNNYLGNYEGVKPKIPCIKVRLVQNESVLDEFSKGEVHLINKVTSSDVINEARKLQNSGIASIADYPRRGLSFLAFVNEDGLTSSVTLRHAIAHLVDRDTYTAQFLNNYGESVYAYYGIGQWMAQDAKDSLKEFDIYPYDLAKAEELLKQDGWTYNKDGQAFVVGKDTLRHKKMGERLVPLSLDIAITEKNQAGELISSMLEENLSKVGGELEITVISMDELLSRYYRQQERGYNLFFLGSNFTFLFDPYYTYHTDEAYQGVINCSGLRDIKLQDLANNMRSTPSCDKDIYLSRWLDFQRYWVEVLPMVPLYSNIYHDVFVPQLENYHPEAHWGWAAAIIYASLNNNNRF